MYPPERATGAYHRLHKEESPEGTRGGSRRGRQKILSTHKVNKPVSLRRRSSGSFSASSYVSSSRSPRSHSSYTSSRSSTRSRSLSTSSSHSSYSRTRSSSSDSSFTRSRSTFSSSSSSPIHAKEKERQSRHHHVVPQSYREGTLRKSSKKSKHPTSSHASHATTQSAHRKRPKPSLEDTKREWNPGPTDYFSHERHLRSSAMPKGDHVSPGQGDFYEGREYRSSRQRLPQLSPRDTYVSYSPGRRSPRRRSPPGRRPDYLPSRHFPNPPPPPSSSSRAKRVVRHVSRRYSPDRPPPRDMPMQTTRHSPSALHYRDYPRRWRTDSSYSSERGRHGKSDRHHDRLERGATSGRITKRSHSLPRHQTKRNSRSSGPDSSEGKRIRGHQLSAELPEKDIELARTKKHELKPRLMKYKRKTEHERDASEMKANKAATEKPQRLVINTFHIMYLTAKQEVILKWKSFGVAAVYLRIVHMSIQVFLARQTFLLVHPSMLSLRDATRLVVACKQLVEVQSRDAATVYLSQLVSTAKLPQSSFLALQYRY